jgi:hypothetical protein
MLAHFRVDESDDVAFGLMKITSDLDVVWATPIEDPPEGQLIPSRAAWNPAGEAAVVGPMTIPAATGNPTDSTKEVATLKYDADGNLLWTARYAYGPRSYGREVAHAPDGSVVVAGVSNQPGAASTGSDTLLLLKYDTDGELVWARTYCYNEAPYSITIDSKGDIYVKLSGGNGILAKFDTDGLPVYSIQFKDQSQAGPIILSRDETALYRIGSVEKTVVPLSIQKFDPETGTLVWTRDLPDLITQDTTAGQTWTGRLLEPSSIEVTTRGIFVTGTMANSYSSAPQSFIFLPYIAGYDFDGELMWFRQFVVRGTGGLADVNSTQNRGQPVLVPNGNDRFTVLLQRTVPYFEDAVFWKVSAEGELL